MSVAVVVMVISFHSSLSTFLSIQTLREDDQCIMGALLIGPFSHSASHIYMVQDNSGAQHVVERYFLYYNYNHHYFEFYNVK